MSLTPLDCSEHDESYENTYGHWSETSGSRSQSISNLTGNNTITTQAMIGYSDSDPKFAAAAVKSRVESFGGSKTLLQTLKAEFFARERAKSIG
jgi:hypothetical protein